MEQSSCGTGACPAHETVKSIIYWKKPIVSAVVLTSLLVFEFGLMWLSAISFAAYFGIMLFVSINVLRFYYHFLNKSENNVVREYLEREIAVPQDKVVNVTKRLVDMTNKELVRAREIFMLSNPTASFKFAVLLYLLTFVGARFNFLTLCVLSTLMAFLIPKFYESYQSEIDKLLSVVKAKLDVLFSTAKGHLDKLPVVGSASRKSKAQ